MKNLLFILLLISTITNAQVTRYFSSSGNDALGGASPSSAWSSAAKFNAITWSNNDTILFKRGDVFTGSFVLDGGAKIGTYGTGNKPLISGFQTLSGWTNVGTNLWRVNFTCPSALNMLTINGQPTMRGRYPNLNQFDSGYLSYYAHSGVSTITTSGNLGGINWTGAKITIRSKTWMLNTKPITAQSATSGSIVITYTGSYTDMIEDPIDGGGFFIQDDIRTLDYQGEWYYDPSGHTLTIYSTVNPSVYTVKASVIDTLLQLPTITGAKIDNIDFEGSNKMSVSFYQGTKDSITNCRINYSGFNGIQTDQSTYAVITQDTIKNTNNVPLLPFPYSHHSVATYNIIDTAGALLGLSANGNYSGCGLIANGIGIKVQYNKVRYIGYNGIVSSGDSVDISYNLVDRYCVSQDDGAGIYTSLAGNGRKITHNTILNGLGNTRGSYEPAALANAIGLDDYSNDVDILYNNIGYASREGIGLHNSTNIRVFYNTIYGVGLRAIGWAHDTRGTDNPNRGFNIKHNTFISTASMPSQFRDEASVPQVYAGTNGLLTMDTRRGFADLGMFGVSDSNVYAKPFGTADYYKYSWQVLPPGTVVTHPGGGATTANDTDLASIRITQTALPQDWQRIFGQDLHSQFLNYTYRPTTVISTGSTLYTNNTFDNTNSVLNPSSSVTTQTIDPNNTLGGGNSLKINFTGGTNAGYGIFFYDGSHMETLLAGHTYKVKFKIKSDNDTTSDFQAYLLSTDTSLQTKSFIIKVNKTIQQVELDFIPLTNIRNHYLMLNTDTVGAQTAKNIWIDNMTINEVTQTYNDPVNYMKAIFTTNNPQTITTDKPYVNEKSAVIGVTKTVGTYSSSIMFSAGDPANPSGVLIKRITGTYRPIITN